MRYDRNIFRLCLKVLASGLAALSFSSAQAQIVSGSDLQKWLASYDKFDAGAKTEENYTDSMVALFYITGVAESYKNTRLLCIPGSVTAGQLTAIVGKYIRANPERWNKHANLLTYEALSPAFSCSNNDKK